jgi:hypothetical protein
MRRLFKFYQNRNKKEGLKLAKHHGGRQAGMHDMMGGAEEETSPLSDALEKENNK